MHHLNTPANQRSGKTHDWILVVVVHCNLEAYHIDVHLDRRRPNSIARMNINVMSLKINVYNHNEDPIMRFVWALVRQRIEVIYMMHYMESKHARDIANSNVKCFTACGVQQYRTFSNLRHHMKYVTNSDCCLA